MSIYNTERLTKNRVDLMNVGLRSYPVSTGEINELAEHFGLGVRTVQRWFAAQGQQYRRCVPAFAYTGNMPGDPVPGWRIFRMFDDDNPSGFGPGYGADGKGSSAPLQNMRLRCVLAACLGVKGGLEREAIYHGKTRTWITKKGSLAEALDGANNVYTGNCDNGFFMMRAWVSMTIEADPNTPFDNLGWLLVVKFNAILPTDESDGREKQKPDA